MTAQFKIEKPHGSCLNFNKCSAKTLKIPPKYALCLPNSHLSLKIKFDLSAYENVIMNVTY